MSKPKKYYLRDLRKIEQAQGESWVRLLEMHTDSILDYNAGKTIQFWEDVKLYGVDEAILYVRNGGDVQAANAIQREWEAIRVRIENPVKPEFVDYYFKDDGTHPRLISGLPLPTDDDGVVRNHKFIKCNFHAICGDAKFEDCDFEDCHIGFDYCYQGCCIRCTFDGKDRPS